MNTKGLINLYHLVLFSIQNIIMIAFSSTFHAQYIKIEEQWKIREKA